MDLKIEKDFEDLLGPMEADAFEQLKENLAANPKSFPPIYVWGNHKSGNIIIDGHNQYKARRALRLPIKPQKVNFETRDEAMAFAIKCQLGRRNLPTQALARLAAIARKSGQSTEAIGVSKRTVQQYEAVLEKGSKQLRDAVDGGAVSIRDANGVLDKPKAEQDQLVREKKSGERKSVSGGTDFDPTTFKKPKPGSQIRKPADRKAALQLLGKLIRALDKLGLSADLDSELKAINQALKES